MKRLGALIVLLTLTVGVLTGCSQGLSGSKVAVVNGHVITRDALNVRVKIYEMFFRQSMGSPASQQQLLDQMVAERILMGQAEHFKIEVSEAQVESEMARFFGALDRQYKNRETVNQKLQDSGLTNDMLADFVTDYLTSQAVADHRKSQVAISEAEVEAYYEQNKDKLYTFGEHTVRAAHILVPLDQAEKAGEIAAKAKAGGDFAELARLYSVDPGSSRMGGDLGYFTKGSMVAEFAEAAFDLSPGEISDPVRSQFGWHVISVLDRQGPGTIALETARTDVLNRLLPEKQDQAFEQWLRELEKAAKVRRASLTEASAR